MKKLYYYSDLAGSRGWFTDPASFRKSFPAAKHGLALRVAHGGIDAPPGYAKTAGKELANDPVERVLTQRDFIRALSPK